MPAVARGHTHVASWVWSISTSILQMGKLRLREVRSPLAGSREARIVVLESQAPHAARHGAESWAHQEQTSPILRSSQPSRKPDYSLGKEPMIQGSDSGVTECLIQSGL